MLAAAQRLDLRHTLPYYRFPHRQRTAELELFWRLVPGKTQPQAAIIVAKKVARLATQRHRLKRQLAELLRPTLPYLASELELVVVVKSVSSPEVLAASWRQLCRQLPTAPSTPSPLIPVSPPHST